MTEIISCPIWETPATLMEKVPVTDLKLVKSPRTGGEFFITWEAESMMDIIDERHKAKLTSWLVEQRWLGEHRPQVTTDIIKESNKRRELTVFERADRTLKYIQNQSPQIGDTVGLLRNQDSLDGISKSLYENITPVDFDMSHYFNALTIRAYSESLSVREVEFIMEYLDIQQKWIGYSYESNSCICNLTFRGYARLAELAERDTISSRAFVAMWFDESMNDLWEQGIEPGVRDAGYDPVRIDKTEPLDKIDDAIIAEIRRSRFVVVDFTHGNEGARGSVYYEAGFAYGIDIPVIFLCRKDMIDKIHFDTRQHKHIEWEKEKPGELRDKLANRISAVIGDGPLKNKY